MFIIDNVVLIRLSFFLSIFSLMAIWEVFAPRRKLTASKKIRWFNNVTLILLNSMLVRWLFPLAAVSAALWSVEHNWGLLSIFGIPQWLSGLSAIVILDFTIYMQHVFFHKILFFWRFHRMHHTDLDIDVTTGARFHPVEIMLSMVIKIAVVIILGAPVWSVIAFEILLNATSMFNHGNIFISQRYDRILRTILVTPDMHRVHHSVLIKETDSNFGFNLSLWDRIFSTYRNQPERGHVEMTIGLANYRDKKWLILPWMLAVPFSNIYR